MTTAPGDNGGFGDPSDDPSKDRRSSARLPVEMWVEEITPGGLVFRRAGNLSVGGIYLDQTIPLAVGSVIKLKFTLPGDRDAIVVSGEIVSIMTDQVLGMGVKFTEVNPTDRSRITGFLKRSYTPVMGV